MKTSTTNVVEYNFHLSEEEVKMMREEINLVRIDIGPKFFEAKCPTIFNFYQKLSAYL